MQPRLYYSEREAEDPKASVRQAISGAIVVVALFTGVASLLSIPNYTPVVAIEGPKVFLGVLLFLPRLWGAPHNTWHNSCVTRHQTYPKQGAFLPRQRACS
ncbi:MAG: hypothetical protein ACLFQZ_13615, partial [Spirochaetaceae bacterium]